MGLRVITDSFFTKGAAHRICEDYAAHNDNKAALSDGCSGVPGSHIGAMLMCEHALLMGGKIFSESLIVQSAKMSLKLINKSKELLSCTLGIVEYNKIYSYVNARICGDGYIWTPKKESEITYSMNVPFYPLYSESEERFEKWISLEQIKNGMDTISNEDTAVIFSDGVSSFIDKNGDPVPSSEVVKHLTDFKSMAPSFIYRRANRCFKKVFPELGWINQDDVSIAGLYKES